MALICFIGQRFRLFWKTHCRGLWNGAFAHLEWLVNHLNSHERFVYLYKPEPISKITGLIGYLKYELPTFLSPK